MLLRKLADHGQAILCTIHQPSSQLFRIFDRLLLLNNQGQTVYLGDIGWDASSLIEYFESRGAPKCQPEDNPAEWVLDVITRSSTEHSEWSQKWNESQQYRDVQQYLQQFNASKHPTPMNNMPTDPKTNEYATSLRQQLTTVTIRIFQEYWRDPTYLYSKLALCAGVVNAPTSCF